MRHFVFADDCAVNAQKSHAARMSYERLPKRLLYGELSVGRRSTGGQRKRYNVFLTSSLKAFDIKAWESLAAERGSRRSLIREGAESSPMNKPGHARQKKRDCSANPVLRKQALRLILIFNARTATAPFVPESALSATSGHIVYMRQTSVVMVIITYISILVSIQSCRSTVVSWCSTGYNVSDIQVPMTL